MIISIDFECIVPTSFLLISLVSQLKLDPYVLVLRLSLVWVLQELLVLLKLYI